MIGFDTIARRVPCVQGSTASAPASVATTCGSRPARGAFNVGRGIAIVLLGVFFSTTVHEGAAFAQGGQCTQACQTAYAQCYKDTGSNRKFCESRLQQCLSSCIDKR